MLNHRIEGGLRGTTLVLIHPLGGDLSFWDDLGLGAVAPGGSVAVDLAGAGTSALGDRPATIARHTGDLSDLIDALGLGRVVAVGCAIGSMTAVALAARRPDRVAGLVLANAVASTIPSARAMLAARADAVARDGMAAVLPGAVERAFLDQPQDERYRRYYERFAAQDAIGYAASIRGILDADIRTELAALACPTLVVTGGRDVLLPPERGREVADLVPGARYETFPEAAHFLPYQTPARFRTLLADFLAEIDRAGP
ncbi:alpha/beta fold hydrolase [Prosthecomicrobium hirschii]|uniref:alpha/beta fold hydrolase n=1 Tax=Prosthecodimorpha hirschii TaxID=665126 RepID=UPI00221F4E29|nr:alpha/beta fold hydrolase [Prosthecomicrobium hirschii]MCW1838530.1 alpha/beta fold hydrolase [Prosthecomicrobium hirschii]